MNRKNAFSYIMWFIYSVAVCISLLGIAGILSRRAGYSIVIGYGVGALWFILCGLIVFMVHKLISNLGGVKESSKLLMLVVESLIVVSLFAVGLFLRISGLSAAGQDAAYYELTKVAEGQTIPSVVHGAVYIYLQLLHLIYLVFGNKFVAGIWLQIVLQVIAGFFLYRAVRKVAGVIASVITLGFIMIGPLMIGEALSLSPEMLFFAIFAIALYMCVSCIGGRKGLVPCLLTGVLIGAVCYLDIIGICLLPITLAGVIQERNEDEPTLLRRISGALLCLLGCGMGFTLLILADSLASSKEFINVVTAWWKLYSPSAFSLSEILNINHTNIEMLVIILVMGIGIFSFWCNSEKECQSIWIWMALFVVVLQAFGMTTTEVSGTLYLYITFIILAGVSLAGMFASVYEDEFRPLGKMIGQDEEEIVESKPVEMQTVIVSNDDVPQNPKVKLLDNPLPLPKKHVKKVLDYDVQLVAGLDDFDLAVDDDDDYDI